VRKAVQSLIILILLAPFAVAQDAMQLLKQVQATYDALPKTTYDFEMVEVMDFPGDMHHVVEQRHRIIGSRGRYREEALPTGLLYVFDGQSIWTLNRDRSEYRKTNNSAVANHPPSGLGMFQIMAYQAKSARLLRQETLELTSGSVACQVIEVERAPTNDRAQRSPILYWIDTTRNLVLKANYTVRTQETGRPAPSVQIVTVSFTRAAVGLAVDEELFRFTPPPDTVQVDQLRFGPKSPLAGQDAPEFSLTGTDKAAITASTLRGKTVLLVFGAQPESEMVALAEMAHRSFRGSGLTVYYVLPKKYQAGIGSQYTVPVAIDADGTAAKILGLDNSYGTILIDGFGKVVFADSGSDNHLDLVKALQKAGVW